MRAILLLFFITLAPQADAFNKKVRMRYNETDQVIHLLGAFEGLMMNPSPSEQVLYECFKETKTSLVQLHNLVLEEYNSSFWKHSNQENMPAAIMLISALKKYCIAKGYNFD